MEISCNELTFFESSFVYRIQDIHKVRLVLGEDIRHIFDGIFEIIQETVHLIFRWEQITRTLCLTCVVNSMIDEIQLILSYLRFPKFLFHSSNFLIVLISKL